MARLEHIQLVFDERNITESPIEDLIPLKVRKVLVKGYKMEHRLLTICIPRIGWN